MKSPGIIGSLLFLSGVLFAVPLFPAADYPSFIDCVGRTSARAGFCGNPLSINPRLSGCFAFGNDDWGFLDCSNLSGCRVYGQNVEDSYGFRDCRNISSSEAYDCDSAGFLDCRRLDACSVDGNGHTDYGFYGCTYLAGCFAENCALADWSNCTQIAASNN